MNSSNAATVQYKNSVLKAYGIVPMEDGFLISRSSSIHLKRDQTRPKINQIALSRSGKTASLQTGEFSMSADEKTQIPFTMKRPSHSHDTQKQRPKITKKDVLKAHGIIQDYVGKSFDF